MKMELKVNKKNRRSRNFKAEMSGFIIILKGSFFSFILLLHYCMFRAPTWWWWEQQDQITFFDRKSVNKTKLSMSSVIKYSTLLIIICKTPKSRSQYFLVTIKIQLKPKGLGWGEDTEQEHSKQDSKPLLLR